MKTIKFAVRAIHAENESERVSSVERQVRVRDDFDECVLYKIAHDLDYMHRGDERYDGLQFTGGGNGKWPFEFEACCFYDTREEALSGVEELAGAIEAMILSPA